MAHDQWCEAQLVPPAWNTAGLCHCRLRELAAEVAALREDAERYRHLCEVHGPRSDLCFNGESFYGKQAFDAAIDADILRQQSQQAAQQQDTMK